METSTSPQIQTLLHRKILIEKHWFFLNFVQQWFVKAEALAKCANVRYSKKNLRLRLTFSISNVVFKFAIEQHRAYFLWDRQNTRDKPAVEWGLSGLMTNQQNTGTLNMHNSSQRWRQPRTYKSSGRICWTSLIGSSIFSHIQLHSRVCVYSICRPGSHCWGSLDYDLAHRLTTWHLLSSHGDEDSANRHLRFGCFDRFHSAR